MNIVLAYTFAYCFEVHSRIRKNTSKRGIEPNTNASYTNALDQVWICKHCL